MPLSTQVKKMRVFLKEICQVCTPEKEQTKIRRATIKILTQNMKYIIKIMTQNMK